MFINILNFVLEDAMQNMESAQHVLVEARVLLFFLKVYRIKANKKR